MCWVESGGLESCSSDERQVLCEGRRRQETRLEASSSDERDERGTGD